MREDLNKDLHPDAVEEHTIENGPLVVEEKDLVETTDQYTERELNKTELTEAEKRAAGYTEHYGDGKEKLIEVHNLEAVL